MENYYPGPGAFTVCIDEFTDGVAKGTLFNLYNPNVTRFNGLTDFLKQADRMMDAAAFPQAFFRRRGFRALALEGDDVEFVEKRRRLKPRRRWEEMICKRGQYETFWVRVLYRSHGSWQGTAVCLDARKPGRELQYRSALELVLAMEDQLQERRRQE